MSNSDLKIIAVVAMIIDHVGAILFPEIVIFRIVGRIAFSVFAFLLVEGFVHTRNVRNYLVRLLFFAFLSEIPYDLAFYGVFFNFKHQNIFFTLFFGLVLLKILSSWDNKFDSVLVKVLNCFVVFMLADVLNLDYGSYGIFLILVMYLCRFSYKRLMISLLIVSIVLLVLGNGIQFFQILSIPIIYQYNADKGLNLKLLFYVVYPVHLLILFLLKVVLM